MINTALDAQLNFSGLNLETKLLECSEMELNLLFEYKIYFFELIDIKH